MNRQTRQNDSVPQSGHPQPNRAKRAGSGLFHWIVAGGSIAALAGAVYFGLQLIERDPSKVPVIKAMTGPSRIAPETPGGEIADHLGLAVNKIQTGTGIDDEADRVSLAPEQHSLTVEETETELAVRDVEPVVEDTALTVEDVEPTEPPEVAAVEPEPGREIVPLSDDDAAAAIAEALALATQSADPAASETPAAAVYQPRLRPSDLNTDVQVAAVIPVATTPEPTSDPAFSNRISEVPVGTKLVQLGAYDSEAQALSEWKKLMGKHSDFLAQKKMLIQPVVSGGRQLYRLRAVGFDGRDAAKGFCTALNARGVACFALTAR